MPQAIVDPEELREFANRLKKFNTQLADALARLRNDLDALGTTWRDQEHQRFVQQFEEHIKVIGRFLELSNQHVPYLVRKADQIDEYLQS